MVVIPAGRFRMGCLSNDDCWDREKPVHEVTIAAPFALSVHEVTFEDYDRFTYPNKVDDHGWGRGRRPVISMSWHDAQDYVAWLSAQTGATYRLPSESEWEYAARTRTTTKYGWGKRDRGEPGELPRLWERVGQRADGAGGFVPRQFVRSVRDARERVGVGGGLLDGSYAGAPSDGSAWIAGDCTRRVVRGGSWDYTSRGTCAPQTALGTPPASGSTSAAFVRLTGLGTVVAQTGSDGHDA